VLFEKFYTVVQPLITVSVHNVEVVHNSGTVHRAATPIIIIPLLHLTVFITHVWFNDKKVIET